MQLDEPSDEGSQGVEVYGRPLHVLWYEGLAIVYSGSQGFLKLIF
jgi:hypothetical protein